MNRFVSCAVLLVGAIATLARADVLPPPIERDNGSISVAKLNQSLSMLHGDRVPMRLVFRDAPDIDVTIPTRFAVKAEKHGLKPTPRPSILTEATSSPGPLLANVVMGLALSACCVAALIWLARRPSWMALAVTAFVVVASAALVVVVLFLQCLASAPRESGNPPPIPANASSDTAITISFVDSDESVRVMLPMAFKPAWMGAENETVYPSPNRPRPSVPRPPSPQPDPPFKDKN